MGCFIYFDTGTGEYSFGEHIFGDPVQLVKEVTATVHFQWNDRFLDPRDPYRYEVAALHSHYPLTWAAPDVRRPSGPSDADEAFLLPGIVYDYTHEVRAGYDPDCYSKKFYPYGPSQRQTPNL